MRRSRKLAQAAATITAADDEDYDDEDDEDDEDDDDNVDDDDGGGEGCSHKTRRPSQKRRKGETGAAAVPTNGPPLPESLALPAILGGAMPAPVRRRRRKDPVPGEPEASDSETEDRLAVRLPRATLLSLSSAQMQHYVRSLRQQFSLTRGQEKELKRQKRLVKNRESARNSRQKKMDHIGDLQGKLDALAHDFDALRTENERLREENARLRSMQKLQQAPLRVASPVRGGGSSSIRLAGVCLLVVLFSFGLVFHASRASDAFEPHSLKREWIPMVSPFGSSNGAAATRQPRTLLETAAPSPTSNALPLRAMPPPAPPTIAELPLQQQQRGYAVPRVAGQWRAQNITYVVARSATRHDPECQDPELSHTIGIVLPASAIRPASAATATTAANNDDDDTLLGLTCNIVDVAIVPPSAFP